MPIANNILLIGNTVVATPGAYVTKAAVALYGWADSVTDGPDVFSDGDEDDGLPVPPTRANHYNASTASTTVEGNWMRAPKGAVSTFFGDEDSVAAYTVDQPSADLRFNGTGGQHGDIGYYPAGAAGAGQFRFSSTAGAINAVPNVEVGVGSLYSVGQVFAASVVVSHATVPKVAWYVGAAERAYASYDGTANIFRIDSDSSIDLAPNNTVAMSLQTDGKAVFGAVKIQGAATFGTLADANLYRIAAGRLHTDGSLSSSVGIFIGYAQAYQVLIGEQGPGAGQAGLRLGAAADTNLYRLSANVLATDDVFRCGYFTTGTRPTPAAAGIGGQIYDATLAKPVWSDGTNWRDAAANIV